MTTDLSTDDRAGALRRQLASQLADGGSLTSPAWRAAVEAVPRHLFVARFYRETDAPGLTTWIPIAPDRVSESEWLRAAYADESLITQFDGHEIDWTNPRPVVGAHPTSSSTMPSLVVRMLELLDVAEGHSVLEIGTGSGYSTALMCHRLGDHHVTSIETDAYVAHRAHTALAAAGYQPQLVAGDGLVGHSANAPYDRIIATCGVQAIPHRWIDQASAGAVVLASLRGWMRSLGLARLTVDTDGTADGAFIDNDITFMIARQQDAPKSLGMLPAPDDGHTRLTTSAPDVLANADTGFLVQLTTPAARHVTMAEDGEPASTYILDATDDSFAVLAPSDRGWTVRQGGPRRLWDSIEKTLDQWHAAGEPQPCDFRIRVTPTGQTIWHPADAALSWTSST